MPSAKHVLAQDGLLATHISGYRPREAQIQMAEQVEHAIKNKTSLIVEAGTGTGKTFAYLIPAILSDQKVIVSTGTKALQEQLFLRDLPLVRKALKSNVSIAMLKGRSNYLCIHRLEQHTQTATVPDLKIVSDIQKVKKWSTTTISGDIGELAEIEEGSPALPYVTSNVDNCLGKDCPSYGDCYMVKARRKAMDSDLVVVNHHLFFADLALRDTGFGELVPEADVIILDEAHQLPDIASDYFGDALSTRQIVEWARDLETVYRTKLKDVAQLKQVADRIKKTVADMRLQFPDDPQRGNWRDALAKPNLQKLITRLDDDLQLAYKVIKTALGRCEEIDNCFERCTQIVALLAKLTDVQIQGVSLWYETTKQHVVLHQTPLDVADRFSKIVDDSKAAWILTSATLTVDDQFDHFQRQLGLRKAEQLLLPSPFDYAAQALLCVPRYICGPREGLAEQLTDIAEKLVVAAKGNTFLLFTSYRMMQAVGERLAARIDNTLLIQGSTNKLKLLAEFMATDDAVLLGTSSFWEGVDVRGDKLICVLIDKLPFAAPDDPLLQAKMDECRRQGGEPFRDVQLPQAVITLKQGVGRLIRDVSDRGVLVICDPRLIQRQYGSTFLRSLPPMRRSRDIDRACAELTQLVMQPSQDCMKERSESEK